MKKITANEPNDFTGVVIVFDNDSHVDIYDVPAVEFDGRTGHEHLARLTNAHGTWINSNNSNDDTFWLYNQIAPQAERYDDKGKQLKGDGPWHKYRLDMEKFNLIHGKHRIFVAGFVP